MRASELVALGRQAQRILSDPNITEPERLAKWQALLDVPDRYDAVQDARSEARYEDDPMAEKDDAWRETLPEKGCG